MNQKEKILRGIEARINNDSITAFSQVLDILIYNCNIKITQDQIMEMVVNHGKKFDYGNNKANYVKDLYLYIAKEALKYDAEIK